jgi:predicted permease
MRWWPFRKRDADLERELRADLDLEEEEQRERGVSAEEARYAALRAFGNPTLIREQTRAVWAWSRLESLARDLRYAARTLARTPGFSLIVILVMGLGIGASVAMFTVVHSVLMKPLPFPEQGSVVQIFDADAHDPAHNHIAVAGPDYTDWLQQQHSFEQMAITWNWNGYNLSGTRGQLPERVDALTASWNLYALLGVKPALGRFFDAADDQQGANAAVVLSWGLWKRRYGGDPGILGQAILLDARPHAVIGVLPRGVDFPDSKAQLWTAFFEETPPEWRQSHAAHNFAVFARLRPGVSVAQAQAETSAIQAGIHQRFPTNWVATATHVVPLLESRVGKVEPALLVLLGATACLLLIGCLNVANLLVARSAARRREAAIRTALGGGRWRLVREQLAESVLLCAAGGALGLFLAWMALRWLVSLHSDIPRAEGIRLDGAAMLAALGIVVFCGLLAGLIPFLTLKERHLLGPLQDSARSLGAGRASAGLRRVLLTLEVALTVVLLVGASLLMKSYQRLRSVDLGCRTRHVLTMGIALPGAAYTTPAARTNFYETLLDRVRALPGVEAAAFTDALPGDGQPPDHGFLIPENPPLPPGQTLDADVASVDPGYFRAMQIPLLLGRFFQPQERLGQTDFAIVSQSFARKFFPRGDPIGKHIRDDNIAKDDLQIVGVVGDVRGSVASAAEPMMYFPLYRGEQDGVYLVVATGPDSLTLALPVQKIIADMDSNLAVADVLTMDQILGRSTFDASLEAILVAAFASVSLLLAAVGLFGVLSYLVAQRQGEIGIRLALGAQRAGVLQLMLLDGLGPAIAGLAVGMLASAAVTRLIQSMLYGTSPFDPATFVLVPIVLLAVGTAACFAPAWRAARLDPMQALRTE